MKQVIIGIIVIILIVIIGTHFYKAQNSPSILPPVSPTPSASLPGGWAVVAAPSGSLIKYQKNVSASLKPQIVFTDNSADTSNPTTYVNQVIAGARGDIPSLNFSINQVSEYQGYYLRELKGSYFNQKTKVLVLERLYLKNGRVYTLTASYGDPSLDAEINTIFDSIASQRLPN